MNIRKFFLFMALGAAVLGGAGCGNNSTTSTVSTNSVSGTESPTNGVVNNNPPVVGTNVPMPTNDVNTATNK